MADSVSTVSHPNLWGGLSLLATLAGCIWLSAVWWQGLLLALLLCALQLGAWLRGRATVSQTPTVVVPDEDPALGFLQSLRALLDALLPLWTRHIELSRSQTAEAVGGLTSQFIAINQQLGQSLDQGGG